MTCPRCHGLGRSRTQLTELSWLGEFYVICDGTGIGIELGGEGK